MNAIDMLHDDHRHLKQMLKNLVDIQTQTSLARHKLVERLGDDLQLHARLEEDVFYPALKEVANGQNDVMQVEALEEHRLIDKALNDLAASCDDATVFEGRSKVLKELLEHHIKEEERDMFPFARTVLTDAQLNNIGHKMAMRRADLFSGVTEDPNTPAPAPAKAINRVLDTLSSAANQAEHTVEAVATHPVQSIGRGVEEVVRVGANLASELISGVRKGLTDPHHQPDNKSQSKISADEHR